MNDELSLRLEKMNASYPYNNPAFRNVGRTGKLVPTVTSHERNGRKVKFTFEENGAKVVQANLIYSRNGNDRNEEWFRAKATLDSTNTVIADLPQGTTHYIINLIDQNNFLVSYPDVPGGNHFKKTKEKFAKHAISVDAEN